MFVRGTKQCQQTVAGAIAIVFFRYNFSIFNKARVKYWFV